MTVQQMNVAPEQAEIMWRALWVEIEAIEKGYSPRRTGAREAFNAHLNTIALLRQINTRFSIIHEASFNEMVEEASLASPLFP